MEIVYGHKKPPFFEIFMPSHLSLHMLLLAKLMTKKAIMAFKPEHKWNWTNIKTKTKPKLGYRHFTPREMRNAINTKIVVCNENEISNEKFNAQGIS